MIIELLVEKCQLEFPKLFDIFRNSTPNKHRHGLIRKLDKKNQ